jgi:exodeoxyribonuclease VII large subunit
LLVSLGPDSVLKRGFTLTLGPDGKPVRRLADVRPGDILRTRLAEGEITSTVNS